MENIKKMKEIIKQMLFMAYDEKNRDLANIASDLMFELSITYDCPSDRMAEYYRRIV